MVSDPRTCYLSRSLLRFQRTGVCSPDLFPPGSPWWLVTVPEGEGFAGLGWSHRALRIAPRRVVGVGFVFRDSHSAVRSAPQTATLCLGVSMCSNLERFYRLLRCLCTEPGGPGHTGMLVLRNPSRPFSAIRGEGADCECTILLESGIMPLKVAWLQMRRGWWSLRLMYHYCRAKERPD